MLLMIRGLVRLILVGDSVSAYQRQSFQNPCLILFYPERDWIWSPDFSSLARH